MTPGQLVVLRYFADGNRTANTWTAADRLGQTYGKTYSVLRGLEYRGLVERVYGDRTTVGAAEYAWGITPKGQEAFRAADAE